MIVLPLDAGAVHDTVACESPATALTPVGASGTVGLGITDVDGSDASPVPTLFVAVTVNVYGVPSVRPTTAADVAPAVVAVTLPGDDVTVYMVIALPPSDDGAVHETVACVSPGTALTAVGAPGTAAGVTADEGDDAGPVPTVLVAVTMNVYAVPSARPVTSAEVAPPVVAVKPPGEDVTV